MNPPRFRIDPDIRRARTLPAAYHFWLFPATMLNFYPCGLSPNVVQPLAVGRTRVTFLSYALDPSLRGRGAGADTRRGARSACITSIACWNRLFV